MKLNYYIESMPFCEVFSRYDFAERSGFKYLVPDRNAVRKPLSAEKSEEAMIELLNIGKKIYYGEKVTDSEVLSFVEKYGLLGFMEDFSINSYFTTSNTVFLRGCNLIIPKDAVNSIDLIEYMEIFYPRLKETQLRKIVKEANLILNEPDTEMMMTQNINRKLIFSEEYGEPIDMIFDYAKTLYESLKANINEAEYGRISPLLSIKGLGNEIHRTPTEYGVRFNYLKQAIDFCFLSRIVEKPTLLKICKFCKKAFLANNIKLEYDSHSCKNKANVYKTRGKFVESEVVAEDGAIIQRISKNSEVSNTLRKKFNK